MKTYKITWKTGRKTETTTATIEENSPERLARDLRAEFGPSVKWVEIEESFELNPA